MKKTINAGIAKRSFVMDEDAYARLETYLNNYRSRITLGEKKDVMDALEERIADFFEQETSGSKTVIDLNTVNKVISQIGMPDGSDEFASANNTYQSWDKPRKKLYRDPDDKLLGGVCSGLAAYFNTDVVIIRILFVALFVCASAGLWAYIIFWIVTPMAQNAVQKCEMRGLDPTFENMSRFSSNAN